jgi:hypothetical protein
MVRPPRNAGGRSPIGSWLVVVAWFGLACTSVTAQSSVRGWGQRTCDST